MANNKVIVYIDGFNLYYGAVKGTSFKWLNVQTLCQTLLRPGDELRAIKYYTALVKPRPNDPGAPIRQQVYLRALRTLPNLYIYLGHFLSHTVKMPLASSVRSGATVKYVDVLKTEEKGSDVNLATHLLHDAHKGNFALAVVVSNDSDLVEPIRIVRGELGKKVGLFNPQIHQKHPSWELSRNVDFVKNIRIGVLKICQFPGVLKDSQGEFHEPSEW
jgi:hypothetical protein